ncbi:MAG TPA: lysophospholipid acyltransferase family protein [Atribacteraceae bacterium]|nr:lysophospholipid acyltransferase family protein [Atribacteraceae bacterium]
MIYYLSKYIALFLLHVLFRLRTSGRENFPNHGPVIIVSNHSSYLDPIVIGCAAPRRVHFVAKEELFRSKAAAFFLKQLGAFPLKRSEGDRHAVKTIFTLLKQGRVVCLFPEGTRNEGRILPLRSGAVKLLQKSGVSIVLAGVRGTYESWPRGRRNIRLHPISVVFAPPLDSGTLERDSCAMFLKTRMEELIGVP